MFCYKCGKQIPDESTFCSYCGANVVNPKATVSQESKGGINRSVENFFASKNITLGKYTLIILIICVAMLLVNLILPNFVLIKDSANKSYPIYYLGDNTWPSGSIDDEGMEALMKFSLVGSLVLLFSEGLFVLQDKKKYSFITAIINIGWSMIGVFMCMGIEESKDWLSVVPVGLMLYLFGAIALLVFTTRDYKDEKAQKQKASTGTPQNDWMNSWK